MATIRPDDLPAAASVANTVAIPVDSGSAVEKATPLQIVDAAIPLASQADAEAGSDNAKRMTPLRTSQAIAALGVSAAALDAYTPNPGTDMVRASQYETAAQVFAQQVRITTYGAVFDVADDADIANATDDTAAWNAALAHLVTIGGGTLILPPGGSKVTDEIDIPTSVPIRIVGTGSRGLYPGAFVAGVPVPSTVVPVHNGRSTFRFVAAADGDGSFCAEDFSIATLETGTYPDSGFGWDTASDFLYSFTFTRMGVYGFKNPGVGEAFVTYHNSGDEFAVGAVLIQDCFIHRNNWICRSLNSTQFNGFKFLNNKAGQNGAGTGTGGLDIAGHNVDISDNILEGQRDAVRVAGSYQSVTVRGNYFESNTGSYCILLSTVLSFTVGPNNYRNITADHKVWLNSTGFGTCVDSYWATDTHKMGRPFIGTNAQNTINDAIDTDTAATPNYGYAMANIPAALDVFDKPDFIGSLANRTSSNAREVNPLTGEAVPFQEYTTTGTGIVTMTQAITCAAGDWVVATIVFKRTPDGLAAGPNPLITMNVNNTSAAGTRSNTFAVWERYWQDGEWCMLTAAIKPAVAMTSLGVYFYPHGLNPTAGRVSRFLAPHCYTVTDINKVKPWINRFVMESVTAAPASGTWVVGDLLRLSTGGFTKCTASGTPGTWASI